VKDLRTSRAGPPSTHDASAGKNIDTDTEAINALKQKLTKFPVQPNASNQRKQLKGLKFIPTPETGPHKEISLEISIALLALSV